MKQDIHPKYNKVTIQFPKGDTFETYSALSEDKLFVDVDFRKHPAWTKKGVASANASNAKVSKFNEKFGSFDFSSSAAKKAAAPAAPKEDPAPQPEEAPVEDAPVEQPTEAPQEEVKEQESPSEEEKKEGEE